MDLKLIIDSERAGAARDDQPASLSKMKQVFRENSVLVFGVWYGRTESVVEAIRQGARGYVKNLGKCDNPRVSGPVASNLSLRELEVINYMCDGKTNADIALAMGISESTIKFHSHQIFIKLRVKTRTEAVITCLRKGYIY